MVTGFERIIISVPEIGEAADEYRSLMGVEPFPAELSDAGKVLWFDLGNTVVVVEHDRTAGGTSPRSLQLAFRLHELLPNSHLWIVPNEGHRTFDGPGKPEFVRVANEFFSGEWE